MTSTTEGDSVDLDAQVDSLSSTLSKGVRTKYKQKFYIRCKRKRMYD